MPCSLLTVTCAAQQPVDRKDKPYDVLGQSSHGYPCTLAASKRTEECMTKAEVPADPRALPEWARRPPSLAGALTAELVGRIVRGEYAPGSALPAEPALCDAFSVSRTVVREAVKVLQEKGLVQVRRGLGTIVTPPAMWSMLDE